jgi:hypothetical protein
MTERSDTSIPANTESLVDSATEIVSAAQAKGVTLRIMGATAVCLHCADFDSLRKDLGREISDVDLMGYSNQTQEIIDLLHAMGYDLTWGVVSDARKIFEAAGKPHVDIFFDALRMCHKIDFRKRLTVDSPTIPLAELSLEKLQIVNLTEKDAKDIILMFRAHELGEGDREMINLNLIAKYLSEDWGFYYTVTTNLLKVKSWFPKFPALRKEDQADVDIKISRLLKVINDAPKSFAWKTRAKVGTKVQWYQKVEEVYR